MKWVYRTVFGLAASLCASFGCGDVATTPQQPEMRVSTPGSMETPSAADGFEEGWVQLGGEYVFTEYRRTASGFAQVGDMLGIPVEDEGLVTGLAARQNARWIDATVRYRLEPSVSAECKTVLLDAAKAWEQASGIRFKEELESGTKGVVLLRSGVDIKEGYAFVGDPGQTQPSELGIGSAQCTSHVALHLWGHVLGAWHEHQRPDRDEYLEIRTENLMDGHELRFIKYASAAAVGTFDYDSVMLAAGRVSSKNGEPTVIDLRSGEPTKGNLVLSAGDVEGMRTYYEVDSVIEPPASPNLLSNGNFEERLSSWQFDVYLNAAATIDFVDADAPGDVDGLSAKIEIQNAGEADWHVELKQDSFDLEVDRNNILTFDMKCEGERVFDAVLSYVSTNTEQAKWVRQACGEQWQQYALPFRPVQSGEHRIKLTFGGKGQEFMATAYVDNVRFQQDTAQ